MNGLSVIIPLANAYNGSAMPQREEALSFALENFYAKHSEIEVILVCQNYDLPMSVYDSLQAVKNNKIIALQYPVFNKGWCCNVGARAAMYDHICIAESDMWCDKPYLNNAVAFMVREKLSWCFGWNSLTYTDYSSRESIVKYNKLFSEPGILTVSPKRGSSEGGIVLFSRAFFLAIGGCNEWFEELGGPDNELAFRAKAASGSYIAFPQKVYHLWHPRVRDNGDDTRKRNRSLYKYTVKNVRAVNRFLSRCGFGNKNFPLCLHQKFVGG